MKRLISCWLFLVVGLFASEEFEGQIFYSQKAVGGEGAEMYNAVMPGEVRIYLGKDDKKRLAYRHEEVGGSQPGAVIYRRGGNAALFLDEKAASSELGRGSSLDDQEDIVKKTIARMYETKLKDTGEGEKILGYEAKKFEVLDSGFVKKGAKAHVWVAEGLEIGRHRYDFRFKGGKRVISPLPQSIPVEKGTILKAVVVEGETTVTVEATKVEEGPLMWTMFVKPGGYAGEDFPKALEPMPAREGGGVDVGEAKANFVNGVGMKMILVKPGKFRMGVAEGEALHSKGEIAVEVEISRGFYLGSTEVTQAQWESVMGKKCESKFKGADLPVENLTWEDAVAFCEALSKKEGRTYRLPTEAEWEYAARAGEGYKPESRSVHKKWLSERAWFYDNAGYKTHPVAKLKPNGWGFYDLLGNVGEYTVSGFGPMPEVGAKDPQGWISEEKVLKGDGWVASEINVRYGARARRPKDEGKSTIGFRVVCE